MPSRIIREEILTSGRIEQLDPPAEVFYRRLLSKVDDHGLYDARPSILRASLFPLRIDRVREADCTRWMAACQKAGLIALYSHAGNPYLKVMNTRWVARSEPKYPQPPVDANSCAHLKTDVPVVVDVVVSEDVVVSPRKRGKPSKISMPEDFGISDKVRAWAAEKGYKRLDEHLDSFKRKCAANGYQYVDWDAAFMEAIRGDWAKLATPNGNGNVAPSAVQTKTVKEAMKPSETPLERDLARARQDCHFGIIDTAERDRRITEATNKHRNSTNQGVSK